MFVILPAIYPFAADCSVHSAPHPQFPRPHPPTQARIHDERPAARVRGCAGRRNFGEATHRKIHARNTLPRG